MFENNQYIVHENNTVCTKFASAVPKSIVLYNLGLIAINSMPNSSSL